MSTNSDSYTFICNPAPSGRQNIYSHNVLEKYSCPTGRINVYESERVDFKNKNIFIYFYFFFSSEKYMFKNKKYNIYLLKNTKLHNFLIL